MKENIFRIVSILLIIAIGLYSAVAQNNPTRLVIVLPLVAVLITFLLFLFAVGQVEQRINQSLDRRLPPIEHLEKREDVENQTVKLVTRAADFIIATGGRSRNTEYLKAIEDKILRDLEYWRFIYEDEITHAMCKHIISVVGKDKVFIRQIKGREYGNMLIVDGGLIMGTTGPWPWWSDGYQYPER